MPAHPDLTLELLADDMLTLEKNLEITEEKAAFAANGLNSHTAHLAVIEAILVEIMRQKPIDLAPIRAAIAKAPEYLRSAQSSLLGVLEQRAKAPKDKG